MPADDRSGISVPLKQHLLQIARDEINKAGHTMRSAARFVGRISESEIAAIFKNDPEGRLGLERLMRVVMSYGRTLDVTVDRKPLGLSQYQSKAHRPPVREAA